MATQGIHTLEKYDVSYETPDKEDIDEKSVKFTIYRASFLIAQVIMFIGAVMIVMAILIVENDGIKNVDPSFDTFKEQLVSVPAAAAILSLITAIIGCIGMIYNI